MKSYQANTTIVNCADVQPKYVLRSKDAHHRTVFKAQDIICVTNI